MSIKVTHNLHIIGNRKFPKDLFCDAWLTKDRVSLIPVHRVILAGVSDKFKKLFQCQDEEGGGRVHVVRTPLDYDILKRVVNFIYDGQIVLKNQEEHADFMDALATLKVEVGDTVTRDRRSSGNERRVEESGKLTQGAGRGESRRKSSSSGRGRGDREAKLNAKLMKLSREGGRERRSHSTDSRKLKSKGGKKSPEKQGGVEERSKREDFIANAKSQPCMFYAKGYCMRGTSCWFNHEKPSQMPVVKAGAGVLEKGSFEEETQTSQEPRHMLLRLVDYTVTVKTLDLEEYFSQFGEVLEVKFTGLSQEGWSNFNLEVRWADTVALQALQKQSHSIKGTDVMVKQARPRDSGSCSRGGKEEKKSEREIGRSRRGRGERRRKRSRSRSRMSKGFSHFSKEDARKPEKRWRGSSQSRVEEKDAVGMKEIKLEKRDTCQGLVRERDGENISGGEKVSKEQVKVKEEMGEVAKASDGVPEVASELPKEDNHLARLLKEDEDSGASPKKVILVMVLVFEEKEKAVKLLVNPRKQVAKAMQEMAKHLKKDPASLLFSLEKGGRRLTGKEMMGDLEGARIVVTRLF